MSGRIQIASATSSEPPPISVSGGTKAAKNRTSKRRTSEIGVTHRVSEIRSAASIAMPVSSAVSRTAAT